jgi:hypothetical protein
MTPEEWQFLTQQGVHTTNPVQPLTEEQASVAKIPLYMTPIVGQGLAGYDAYHSASQGNYGTAAAEAAMGFLPVHKPVLAALNAIKRNALPVAAAGAVTALPTDAEAAPSYNGIEGLYSRMAEAVKGWSGKNTGANWLGRLKNEPGVPGAELKWSPARKWLETSGEKPITAEELRAYIDSNPIPISQKTLGGDGARTRYAEYTLPGEVSANTEKLFHFNPVDDSKIIEELKRRGMNYPERMLSVARRTDMPTGHLDELHGAGTGAIVESAKRQTLFSAPHFAGHDKNLAAHTRNNVRELPNGEKAYHVEEIQSDWAQKGRDKGFRPDEGWTPDNLPEGYRLQEVPVEGRLIKEEPEHILYDRSGEPVALGTSPQNTLDEARDHLNKVGLPRQPLAEEQKGLPLYGSMAFRKNLYDAAKADADHMTWTTGRQQAERFPDENNAAGMAQFYDRKMRKIAEIEAKRLGIKSEEHLGSMDLGPGTAKLEKVRSEVGNPEYDSLLAELDDTHMMWGNSREPAHQRNAETAGEIYSRLHSGTPLSDHHMDFLDRYFPELYEVVSPIQESTASSVVHSFKLTPELRKQILEKGLPFLGIGAGAKILNDQRAAPTPLDNAMPPGA